MSIPLHTCNSLCNKVKSWKLNFSQVRAIRVRIAYHRNEWRSSLMPASLKPLASPALKTIIESEWCGLPDRPLVDRDGHTQCPQFMGSLFANEKEDLRSQLCRKTSAWVRLFLRFAPNVDWLTISDIRISVCCACVWQRYYILSHAFRYVQHPFEHSTRIASHVWQDTQQ